MDNPEEDAIIQKWSEQQKLLEQQTANEAATGVGATKKRRRIADTPADDYEIFELLEDDAPVLTRVTQKCAGKKAPATSSQPG
jgi:hypothetical protein